jgi:fructokinase
MPVLDSRVDLSASGGAGSILIVGEALVDIVDRGDAAIRTEFVGGSPANVAVALARLGRRTDFLAALAPDARGERIAQQLSRSGVNVLQESWTAERTSTALAEIRGDGSARYAFDIDWALPSPIDVGGYAAVHTGSIAAFLEPGARVVRELLRAARGHGAMVTFDPNIREALLPSRELAVATFESTVALSHVVKLSDEDAAWLYPGHTEEQLFETLLGLGADLVTVTAGGDGATLATHSQRVSVPAVAVDVVDTIGAGDTFMATLIAQAFDVFAVGARSGLLALGPASLGDIGALSARASAITVSRAGANPPTAAELMN